MRNTVLGILAHVDAGKTTMSEAMLYKSGRIRSLGRVDHKDAYLDTNRLEKDRGITIFSKQAIFETGDLRIFLQDTPGHVDFSSEMERTLSVLDYAMLVISGPDGIQAHTRTLMDLLSRYRIPFFIWVNKMDICTRSKEDLMEELRLSTGGNCVDFSTDFDDSFYEAAALSDESALEMFLEQGCIPDAELARLIAERKLVPCWFGSALRLTGIEDILTGMERFIIEKKYPKDVFGARVFKISRDEQGNRMSWLKITGGELKVRDVVEYASGDGSPLAEKITQIRRYSGARFEAEDSAQAGTVCAVCGLSASYTGQGLGAESDAPGSSLEPVLTYRISVPDDMDDQTALKKLKVLGEEDPLLRIVWNPQLREIQAQLMGEVQIEVLRQLIADRFDMDVRIEAGRIMYRETIAAPVEGMGHFEPLRHYAEVHLLLEPLPPGTGLVYESACSTDDLELSWQRLIIGNLIEKKHLGVLTGSPVTDMKITLIAGRTHLKHTEGGDIRQAALRAVRQGLMQAENVLLEPFYSFKLEVPSEQIGRAISDIKAMSASFDAPKDLGGSMLLTGKAPVSEMQDYQVELLSYTKGKGKLSCRFDGYYPCHNTEKVIEETGYEADRDVENTADSVFCSHGAGINVKWDKAPNFMHIDSGLRLSKGQVAELSSPKVRSGNIDFDEKELEAIMEREFGPIKRPQYSKVSYNFNRSPSGTAAVKKEYLIIDGYNVIFAWDELKKTAAEASIALAREKLIDILCNYKGYKGCELVLVFDGYRVPDNRGTKEETGGIRVIYTKENESADMFIEKLVYDTGKSYSITVASSDGMIQLSALRQGVRRMSSRELKYEVDMVAEQINGIVNSNAGQKNRLGDSARISQSNGTGR